ncbi:MAG: hypothetical protein ACJ76Y_01515 [Thermoanaerobaculia bacterium]
MALVVMLNIFSGRPNPVWLLSEEQSRELLGRISSIQVETSVKAGYVNGGFGYQGFSITSAFSSSSVTGFDLHINGGIVDPGTRAASRFDEARALESWLLSTASDVVDQETRNEVQEALSAPAEDVLRARLSPPRESEAIELVEALMGGAIDAPTFKPELWLDDCTRKKNNCYNYALDKITNSYAQPGRAYVASIVNGRDACYQVKAAAQTDGLEVAKTGLPPLDRGLGWYVALAVKSGSNEYHWFRQDSDGYWSHKLGKLNPSRTDARGKIIRDPEHCDRFNYDHFCGYMVAKHGLLIT